MKRRDFLKIMGTAVIAPSVLLTSNSVQTGITVSEMGYLHEKVWDETLKPFIKANQGILTEKLFLISWQPMKLKVTPIKNKEFYYQ